MSKERARRRAEREAKLAEEHRERERAAKAAKQKAAAAPASGAAGRLAGRRCGPSAPTRGGRRVASSESAGCAWASPCRSSPAVQVAAWLYSPSWYFRFLVFGLSLLIAPVIYTLTTNRKA